MNNLKKSNASVLLYVLLILSIITFLTLELVKNSWVGYKFDETMILREQAKVLALSSVQLAISQLTIKEPEKKDLKQGQDAKIIGLKNFLYKVLPNINRWQVFKLTQKYDSIDAEIKICITCENGKININEAFDFSKQEFKKEYADFLKNLYIKNKLPEGELLKRLTDMFKKRKRKLDDITELANIEGLEGLDFFYKPPKISAEKKPAIANTNIFLQDLFTIVSEKIGFDLLFLSDSLIPVIGLTRRPLATDANLLKDKFKNIIENFKTDWPKNWDANWQNISPILGDKPKNLQALSNLLSKEFEPKVYSVISCANIKGVEQKVLVYLKEFEEKVDNKPDNKTAGSVKKDESKPIKTFKIVKIYWI